MKLLVALAAKVLIRFWQAGELAGWQATAQLAQGGSRAKILMLTTFNLDEYVYHAMKAGASGFLLKDASGEQLADAIRAVCAGETLLAPAITRRLIEDFCRGPAPGPPAGRAAGGLSERERQVVRLIAAGLSNAEIAARLYLSEATIKSHITRILARLGLRATLAEQAPHLQVTADADLTGGGTGRRRTRQRVGCRQRHLLPLGQADLAEDDLPGQRVAELVGGRLRGHKLRARAPGQGLCHLGRGKAGHLRHHPPVELAAQDGRSRQRGSVGRVQPGQTGADGVGVAARFPAGFTARQQVLHQQREPLSGTGDAKNQLVRHAGRTRRAQTGPRHGRRLLGGEPPEAGTFPPRALQAGPPPDRGPRPYATSPPRQEAGRGHDR